MKIRVVGSKASIEWFAERPNQLRYEIEGEAVRILERGAGYLHDLSKETDRIGAGHPEGLFESWSNMYRRFAIAIDAASRNDQEFLETFWYPNVKEGAEGVKFVEACVQSDKEGASWIKVK
jgi:predicted dehydrogenase